MDTSVLVTASGGFTFRRVFCSVPYGAIRAGQAGLATKTLALTDALGNLVRFVLRSGQRYDTVGVAPLIQNIEFDGLIGDNVFDADWIIDELNERGAKVIISQRPNRLAPIEIDPDIYQWRQPDRELLRQAHGVQTYCHISAATRPITASPQ